MTEDEYETLAAIAGDIKDILIKETEELSQEDIVQEVDNSVSPSDELF
jgi:hypothetical protein